jgi:malic enzyme
MGTKVLPMTKPYASTHAASRASLKISPTKPMATQRDLSLAYSPGVAVPVKAIADNPDASYDLTARGNMVAVISNGTAILGLGNFGRAGFQAGDGRQGGFVQTLCRC